jgi:hypothetical protein
VNNSKDMTRTMVRSVQHMNKVQQHNFLEICKNKVYFDFFLKVLNFYLYLADPLLDFGLLLSSCTWDISGDTGQTGRRAAGLPGLCSPMITFFPLAFSA